MRLVHREAAGVMSFGTANGITDCAFHWFTLCNHSIVYSMRRAGNCLLVGGETAHSASSPPPLISSVVTVSKHNSRLLLSWSCGERFELKHPGVPWRVWEVGVAEPRVLIGCQDMSEGQMSPWGGCFPVWQAVFNLV